MYIFSFIKNACIICLFWDWMTADSQFLGVSVSLIFFQLMVSITRRNLKE